MDGSDIGNRKKLEGPGAETRLRRVQTGFRRASRKRREAETQKLYWLAVIGVFIGVALAVWFALGWIWRV